jgi:hypothetical protein
MKPKMRMTGVVGISRGSSRVRGRRSSQERRAITAALTRKTPAVTQNSVESIM